MDKTRLWPVIHDLHCVSGKIFRQITAINNLSGPSSKSHDRALATSLGHVQYLLGRALSLSLHLTQCCAEAIDGPSTSTNHLLVEEDLVVNSAGAQSFENTVQTTVDLIGPLMSRVNILLRPMHQEMGTNMHGSGETDEQDMTWTMHSTRLALVVLILTRVYAQQVKDDQVLEISLHCCEKAIQEGKKPYALEYSIIKASTPRHVLPRVDMSEQLRRFGFEELVDCFGLTWQPELGLLEFKIINQSPRERRAPPLDSSVKLQLFDFENCAICSHFEDHLKSLGVSYDIKGTPAKPVVNENADYIVLNQNTDLIQLISDPNADAVNRETRKSRGSLSISRRPALAPRTHSSPSMAHSRHASSPIRLTTVMKSNPVPILYLTTFSHLSQLITTLQATDLTIVAQIQILLVPASPIRISQLVQSITLSRTQSPIGLQSRSISVDRAQLRNIMSSHAGLIAPRVSSPMSTESNSSEYFSNIPATASSVGLSTSNGRPAFFFRPNSSGSVSSEGLHMSSLRSEGLEHDTILPMGSISSEKLSISPTRSDERPTLGSHSTSGESVNAPIVSPLPPLPIGAVLSPDGTMRLSNNDTGSKSRARPSIFRRGTVDGALGQHFASLSVLEEPARPEGPPHTASEKVRSVTYTENSFGMDQQTDVFGSETMNEPLVFQADSGDIRPEVTIWDVVPVIPPVRVLIVEDNPINQKILRMMLRSRKIQHDVATTGAEAVEKWKSGGFHIILMDIALPIMSGIEATKIIRDLETEAVAARRGGAHDSENHVDCQPVIIVALTASTLEEDKVDALAAGCNDFLTKPVDKIWLERKIVEWGCMQALIAAPGSV